MTTNSEPALAELVDILRVHDYQYVNKIQEACKGLSEGETGMLDADTTVTLESFQAGRFL